jgi:hypothetical protein
VLAPVPAATVAPATAARAEDGAAARGLVERDRRRPSGSAGGVARPRPVGRLAVVAGVTAAWLLFAALLAWQALLFTEMVGEPIPPARFWLIGVGSLAWVAFSFAIAAVTRRFPLGYGFVARSLAAHVVACLAVWAAATGLVVAVDEVFGWVAWPDPPPATAAAKFLQGGLTEFADVIVRYGLVVGVAHALSYRRLLREGERRAATLEDRLAQGELRLLTLQLQPQFLFDTLRAVGDRVESDPRDAERMLARLSDLLRLVLESEDRQEVTLEEELDALAPYVKVQQMRLGGGLRVTPEVEDGAFAARVPNLVLQPLVDHALRHANARRPGREAIAIRARRRNGNLELEIRDDGPDARGAPPARIAPAPAGDLLSTQIRLRQMYGADGRLEVSDAPGGGMRVALAIPWRADPVEPVTGLAGSGTAAAVPAAAVLAAGASGEAAPPLLVRGRESR